MCTTAWTLGRFRLKDAHAMARVKQKRQCTVLAIAEKIRLTSCGVVRAQIACSIFLDCICLFQAFNLIGIFLVIFDPKMPVIALR